MKIEIVRDVFARDTETVHGWTLSRVYIDYEKGKGLELFGFACEDMDRGLDSSMGEATIREHKIKGRTAIPVGTSRCGIHIHNGKPTIHLLDVLGYQWILIHVGNSEKDTEGCLLVGLARDVKEGIVLKSRTAMEWFDKHVLPEARAGRLTVTVRRDKAAWEQFQAASATPPAKVGVVVSG